MKTCKECGKEFDSRQKYVQHMKDKHGIEKMHLSKGLRNNFLVGGALILAVVAIIAFLASDSGDGPYTEGEVHWHADLSIMICGEQKELPHPSGDAHIGTPLLHTHDDQRVHVEGKVWSEDDITLNSYLNAINIPFEQGRVYDTQDGDSCDGQPGTWTLLVDGEDMTQTWGDYVIQDEDDLRLVFD